jgi:hypothetical protein
VLRYHRSNRTGEVDLPFASVLTTMPSSPDAVKGRMRLGPRDLLLLNGAIRQMPPGSSERPTSERFVASRRRSVTVAAALLFSRRPIPLFRSCGRRGGVTLARGLGRDAVKSLMQVLLTQPPGWMNAGSARRMLCQPSVSGCSSTARRGDASFRHDFPHLHRHLSPRPAT